MADCQFLAGIAGCGLPLLQEQCAATLARHVLEMCQPDGRILDKTGGPALKKDHDFLPGAALLAIARYARAAERQIQIRYLGAHLEWYRRRFHLLHPWGMVGWQTQAWAAVYTLMSHPDYAGFVFEMADWAMDWQIESSGAFLTDLRPSEPSVLTAFLAEGIAAAWALALDLGDKARARRYDQSWQEAMRFMNELIIRPEDAFCVREPGRSIGGVRGAPNSSEVRIDNVSHTLIALIKGALNMRRIG